MTLPRVTTIIVGLTLAGLCACAPRPQAAPAKPVAAMPPKTAPTPARLARMICRNSQTGRKVACGTPNAVMVGLAYD